MGSISRGFRLAKASWAVVRDDGELLVLPVVSFFCSLVVMAVFGLGMVGVGLPRRRRVGQAGDLRARVRDVRGAVVRHDLLQRRGDRDRDEAPQGRGGVDQGRARARAPAPGPDLRVGADHGHRRHDPARPPGARRPDRADPDRHHRDRVDRPHLLRGAGPAVRGGRGRRGHQAVGIDLPPAMGRAVHRQRDDRPGDLPGGDPRGPRGRPDRGRGAARGRPAAGARGGRPHGGGLGLHRRVQRGALPLRDDGRGLRRLQHRGHERLVPPSPGRARIHALHARRVQRRGLRRLRRDGVIGRRLPAPSASTAAPERPDA